ncbi:hypothetical protein LTR05_005893 [Lithohypha guttulata]|uniref:VOC domain-containing protein n=1 Tax=Lithohypha guttulata TaxID=1690604 RepID=A0AAN7SYK1_9EURO|nr:hypothetical protein LTR05_005893 [Lithohypha guttulata]
MAPTFTKITPSLPVSSVPASIDFYTNVLGFRVAGRDGDNHTWLQLTSDSEAPRDDVAVNIYLRRRGFPDLPEDTAFGKIYIRIEGEEDELSELLKKYRKGGAVVKNDMSVKPWGLRDFTIADSDGNLLNFSQAMGSYPRNKPASSTSGQ